MNNLRSIALFQILGIPVVIYLGLLTLTGFVTTAILGILILQGKKIPLKTHFFIAKLSIATAIVHASLAFSIFF